MVYQAVCLYSVRRHLLALRVGLADRAAVAASRVSTLAEGARRRSPAFGSNGSCELLEHSAFAVGAADLLVGADRARLGRRSPSPPFGDRWRLRP